MKTSQHRRRRASVQAALSAVALLLGCATQPDGSAARRGGGTLAVDPLDRAAIERILREQDEAWNRGDLHAFVAGYAEGDRMTYMGKGGAIVRGRAALEERYRKSYPEGRRGTLTFSDLDLRRIGPDDYLALGKWALALPPENPHGVFTLILERGPAGFAIIHDHSAGSD